MQDTQTKQYHNITDKPINVLGVGEIQPHDRISVNGKYLPHVVMENYPGVVEVTALSPEEQEKHFQEHPLAGSNEGSVPVKVNTVEQAIPETPAPLNVGDKQNG